MELKDLQKDIKASLYERMRSPFMGSFILAWCITNKSLFISLLIGNLTSVQKIQLINNTFNNNWLSWQKPILVSVGLIILLPSISILVYFWNEKVNQIKKSYKYRNDSNTLIPIEKLRDLEQISTKRFAKYNEMIQSYEIKIDKLNSFNDELIKEREQLNIICDKVQKSFDNKKKDILILENKILRQDKLINSYGDIEEISEQNQFLSKKLENLLSYIRKNDLFKEPKTIFIDIPHMGEFEIKRLVYEIQELGLYPTFDGDSKGIKIEIPCYINVDKLELLSKQYRFESSFIT